MNVSPLLILLCYAAAFGVASVELSPPPPLLDLDGSGVVDAGDTAQLFAAWGTPDADLTGNGTTDSADLAALLAAWGASHDTGWLHVRRAQWGVEASFDISLIEEINRDLMLYGGEWVEHGMWMRGTAVVYFLRRNGWTGSIYIDEPLMYFSEPGVTVERLPPPGVGWVVRVGERDE